MKANSGRIEVPAVARAYMPVEFILGNHVLLAAPYVNVRWGKILGHYRAKGVSCRTDFISQTDEVIRVYVRESPD